MGKPHRQAHRVIKFVKTSIREQVTRMRIVRIIPVNMEIVFAEVLSKCVVLQTFDATIRYIRAQQVNPEKGSVFSLPPDIHAIFFRLGGRRDNAKLIRRGKPHWGELIY